ncbi:hypothetical protein OSTOST_24076, partial [Ostertagia ostertagi]
MGRVSQGSGQQGRSHTNSRMKLRNILQPSAAPTALKPSGKGEQHGPITGGVGIKLKTRETRSAALQRLRKKALMVTQYKKFYQKLNREES